MLSSTTLNYHEFHNFSGFQHFKKRPFDQNNFDLEQSADNIYKKIKTTLLESPLESVNSLSSQQANSCPSRSFRVKTNHSSDLSRLNDVESNLISNTHRIIDLSTGEYLETIPSVDQLQKNGRPKRPIDSVENHGTMEVNKEDLLLHSLKRIRTSKDHMCNFIEEEEEELDKPIDIMREPKVGYKANSANSVDIPKRKYPNIRFTIPYQKAIAKYMRAQFQHLNNDGSEGKELILYNPRNDEFKDSFIDSNDKIFEISEDTMDLEDLDDQNGGDENQMDID